MEFLKHFLATGLLALVWIQDLEPALRPNGIWRELVLGHNPLTIAAKGRCRALFMDA
jgi:hypothetical protein